MKRDRLKSRRDITDIKISKELEDKLKSLGGKWGR